MKYLDLLKDFKDQELFSLGEVRSVDSHFYRARLNEWQDKGYIKKFLKNYYFFSGTRFDERTMFRAANRIYRPSYISLQSALSYHGLIPEKPLSVTSVSTLRTRNLETPLGRFAYRKVAEKYFSGYAVEGEGTGAFLMAKPEKALVDLFYLNRGLLDEEFINGLRLNLKLLKKLTGLAKLAAAAEIFGNRKIVSAVRRLTDKW